MSPTDPQSDVEQCLLSSNTSSPVREVEPVSSGSGAEVKSKTKAHHERPTKRQDACSSYLAAPNPMSHAVRRKSSVPGFNFWISSMSDIHHSKVQPSTGLGTVQNFIRKGLQQLPTKKRVYRRLMYKNGDTNITAAHIAQRQRQFLTDFFTTLIEAKWRYVLIVFVCGFVLSWTFFAVIWYLICLLHGDFAEPYKTNPVCVDQLVDFTSAYLFSLETQHTIGYGFRHVTPTCTAAVFLVTVQSCFGVVFQALLTGLVFVKISRPKKRANTLIFSKTAVICKRDGVMTLLFRVGDMRRSHVICSSIRCIMIKKRVTSESEVLALEPYKLEVNVNDTGDSLFLAWPAIVEHRITSSSPFWEISGSSLQSMQFEIILILEGVIEATGMSFQARTSYIPSEILWGHRFERLLTYQNENGKYKLDFAKFHNVRCIADFPQCSAKHMEEIGEENLSQRGQISEEDDEDTNDQSLGSPEATGDEDAGHEEGHELTVTFQTPPVSARDEEQE